MPEGGAVWLLGARDPASRVQIPSKIPGAPLRQFYAERRIWHGAGVVLQDLFRT